MRPARLALARLAARFALALLALVALGASARDVTWDGTSYLPIGLRLGSDTRLRMPEEFDDAWERDTEVAVTTLDPQTLIIRPRSDAIEQRLTLRGRRTGTLYLARASTSLPYTPLVVVRNAALVGDAATQATAALTVVGVLRSMMQGIAPAGFHVEGSSRVLLEQAPYRIVAREFWSSPRFNGIVADLASTVAGATIPVVPANIVLRAPELGTLRAAAPERFELDAASPATRLFLVFAR
ncbi:MAG TPA: hypothetical protein VMU33_10360 [Burkholderiaceae bacterium]|nr:hypothetical protein [Burkholderiaceae bacterium]